MKTFVLFLMLAGAFAAGARMVDPTPISTVWGDKVTAENAWREYPRPQMERANWTCLNGMWDYAIVSNAPNGVLVEADRGRILVPFAFESKLSGVGRIIEPNEKMIYRRTFEARPRKGFRTILHFEAVDWRTQVFVNGVEAMDVPHEGDSVPFSIDVTPLLKDGENALKVVVWDPTHTFINAGGKQCEKSHGCFYTRVSGIWQTVWMEEVPERHIRGYKVVSDIDNSTVRFDFDIAGKGDVVVKIDGVSQSGESDESGEVVVKIPDAKLWSPETPHLYWFTAKYGEDSIRGYFAMRKIGKAKDAKGHWRFQLNNAFYFPIGTLDQGWWPDGLLTPPSLAACEYDIRTLKACGFNMMRKHIKIEPRQFYFLCDKIGILLFQDATSPACNSQDKLRALQRYGLFRREWKEEIDHLFNVPSIVMWMPYNEASGQQDMAYSEDVLRWTRRYDPTRLVGGPSGWNDYWGGDMFDTSRGRGQQEVRDPWETECEDPPCDTVDGHYYPGPGQCVKHRNRISILGEFGGLGLKVPDHIWREKGIWGYAGTGEVVSRESNQRHYLKLMDGLKPLIRDGLASTVYTQTTDIELEINGLITYDRKVLKYDADVLKAAHEAVIAEAMRSARGE